MCAAAKPTEMTEVKHIQSISFFIMSFYHSSLSSLCVSSLYGQFAFLTTFKVDNDNPPPSAEYLELCSPHYDKIPAVSQGLIKL
jgi:hypothetical protein